MEKSLDSHGRWRQKIVAFRGSDEEAKISEKEITVYGNPKVYIALKTKLNDVYEELKRISDASEVNDVLLEVIELIAVTMNGMKEEAETWITKE